MDKAKQDEASVTILVVREVIARPDDEGIFYDCMSEEEFEPSRISSVEQTRVATCGAQSRGAEFEQVCVVNVVALEPATVIMTLDAGADVSVAPEQNYNIGAPEEVSRTHQLRVEEIDAYVFRHTPEMERLLNSLSNLRWELEARILCQALDDS